MRKLIFAIFILFIVVAFIKAAVGAISLDISMGLSDEYVTVSPPSDSCLKLVNDTDTLLLVDDSTCLGLEN